jgi:TolB-like protein/lipoprotein NlpI
MGSSNGGAVPSGEKEKSFLRGFIQKLRKRRIIETLAAFIGGGWLLVEVVERLLVGHYKFPEETIDLTVVSIVGALLATLVWRWFRSTEKRPGNVKVEVLLVPLIVLATVAIDLNLALEIAHIPGKTLLVGLVALCIGIVWIILKLSQWAAAMPESGKKDSTVSGLSPVRPEKSIVVLPFTDLSPQKDQEYFCDGMTEEIITDLSHIHDLRVISRNSAMMLKGTPKDTTTIGRELKVQYVLEGSVRKAGNNLRITAQLIDAMNDAHLWAEKYDGTLDDVFDIQEKVSRSIGNALKLKLTPEERQRIFARPIASPEAYDLHIMARHETWRATESGLERASRLVKRGLDLIGDNEILYADLGFINLMYMDTGIKKDKSVLVEAEECIQKVFSLNPESAYGHYLRGMIQRKKRNPQQAVKEFKKSLAINPNHPDPLLWLSWVYGHSGKISEARHLVGRLLKIDPLNQLTYFMSGAVEVCDGKFKDGIKELEKALQMDEQNPFIKFWLARDLSYAQLLGEAHTLSVLIEKEAPGTIWASLATFHRYALENRRSEALQTVTAELINMVRNDEGFPIWMAESYAFLGEAGEAIEWIENAVDWGFINYPFLMEYDPFFANIRGEERFKKLMERVKYEWEHFEE